MAASAGLAVLDVLEHERLLENAAATGAYLHHHLGLLAGRLACVGAVRGTGLLLGLEILGSVSDPTVAKRRTKEIVNALASRARVLIGSEGPHHDILKLRPPMPFLPEHADLLVQAIAAAAEVIDARGD